MEQPLVSVTPAHNDAQSFFERPLEEPRTVRRFGAASPRRHVINIGDPVGIDAHSTGSSGIARSGRAQSGSR